MRASRYFWARQRPNRSTKRTRRSAIKPTRNLRLLTIAAAASFGLLAAPGCATENNSPFHLYDSPLLAGEVGSNYPRSRTYEPFQKGVGGPQQRSDQSARNSGNPASTEIASIGEEEPAKIPSLSAQTQSPPPKGAPAVEQSARPTTPPPSKPNSPKTESVSAAHAADYIWSVYALNGVEFSAESRHSMPKLFRACKARGKIYHSSAPAIGDIVFFHNTEDSNQDGRNNDWYTHAGIVESQGENGTVTFLSYRDGKVTRSTMGLESPDASMDRHGGLLNSTLRTAREDDAPFTQYLAGQLFAGTCSALGDQAQFVIVDNWEPGMQLEK